MEIIVEPTAILSWSGGRVRCALGRGGVRTTKREGDGATPCGTFPLRRVFFRADRLGRPETGLPLRALTPADGWSDDPADPFYNQLVALPHPRSHERLWRDDRLYDVIVVIGYNDAPVEPGAGSALFLHVAAERYPPTAGCIALAVDDLLALLRDCREDDRISIQRAAAGSASGHL